MEPQTMGRVMTEALIENMEDLWKAKAGLIPAAEVRRINVSDALVDTGASGLALPTRLIRQLGLEKRSEKRITSSIGRGKCDTYETVRLTIQGRDCPIDVMEVSDDVPVLIGQIPLEALDLVVDPRAGKVTGNPAHGGEQMYELY